MASLFAPFRRKPAPAAPAATPAHLKQPAVPAWAEGLLASPLAPRLQSAAGDDVLVWSIRHDTSQATISDQFKANAEDYHQRYSASDHFEKLFRQALAATGVVVAEEPRILDLGSGSGVNSVVPCLRLFPGAAIVATDLSGELLEILARYMRRPDAEGRVISIVMDAMSTHVAAGAFDLVTGASILHHLERPEAGIAAAARALKPGGHAIFFEPFDGWAIVRLAYERILAEAQLRGEALEPAVEEALRAMVKDISYRSAPDTSSPVFAHLDDKWLFSRAGIEAAATAAGFAEVRFVPHNDHATLYRDMVSVQMRLATGRMDATLPAWAMEILDGFDAALTQASKRQNMLEGSVVLTKGR